MTGGGGQISNSKGQVSELKRREKWPENELKEIKEQGQNKH